MTVNVTPSIAVIEAGDIYTRWIGVMEGGMVDKKEVYSGEIILKSWDC